MAIRVIRQIAIAMPTAKKPLPFIFYKMEGYPDGGHVNVKTNDFILRAFSAGKIVGEIVVIHSGRKISAYSAHVEESYRRRGVATALYDKAEEITGKEIVPYPYSTDHLSFEDDITEEAQKFWVNRWRKKGQYG